MEIQSGEPAADMDVRASESPPPLPDNEQPPCPDDGYLWTPGYWFWDAAGYYWIPGAWVQPPQGDVLWTPGYWEFVDAVYVFHRGYWARHVGYYGGINYGFGYFGVGFAGGRWVNHSFSYNRTVSNVDARVIHSTYSEPVYNNATVNRVSYNGGPGGTPALMTAREKAVAAEKHLPPTPLQRQYSVQAARTPALMPRTPVSGYQSERGAEHRTVEVTQKPAVFKARAIAGPRATAPLPSGRQHELTRAPPTGAAPPQATVVRASKPGTTGPALSRPQLALPYPK